MTLSTLTLKPREGVANELTILLVIVQSVVMTKVVMLSVIITNVVMLSVVMPLTDLLKV
jgi:hypothetical protein